MEPSRCGWCDGLATGVKVVLVVFGILFFSQIFSFVLFTKILDLPIIMIPRGAQLVGEVENYYAQYKTMQYTVSVVLAAFALLYMQRRKRRNLSG